MTHENSLSKFHKYLNEMISSLELKASFLSPEQRDALREKLLRILELIRQ